MQQTVIRCVHVLARGFFRCPVYIFSTGTTTDSHLRWLMGLCSCSYQSVCVCLSVCQSVLSMCYGWIWTKFSSSSWSCTPVIEHGCFHDTPPGGMIGCTLHGGQSWVAWDELWLFVAKTGVDDLLGGANPRGDDWWKLVVCVHGPEPGSIYYGTWTKWLYYWMPYVGVGQILDTHMCADTVWLKRDQIMHTLTYRVDERVIPMPTGGGSGFRIVGLFTCCRRYELMWVLFQLMAVCMLCMVLLIFI